MTEASWLWTTGGAGDGASTYTRANWSDILKVIAACLDDEGVAPAYLNALAPSTTGANNARIATGGALVDGKPYLNNANVDVTIPSAVGGGNTRIDRVVLRADWTAQTVRITRIAGVDAASPSAPAITQTPGTTYDIMLCQALVNTSGAVTLTDERVFAKVGSANGLADGIVALAKLAADSVDDTKAGDRVPQFYRRQGGSATDWSSPGTTTRTPGAVRMQAGAITINPTENGSFDVAVTFPTAFSDKPMVIVGRGDVNTFTITVSAITITASGFTLRCVVTDLSGATSGPVFWLAIGPE